MNAHDIDIDSHNAEGPAESPALQESFAELLEKSSKTSRRLQPGQKVRTRVISISGDYVYVDLHGKSEGIIDRSEFVDESGTVAVHEDDEIDAFFVSAKDGIRK